MGILKACNWSQKPRIIPFSALNLREAFKKKCNICFTWGAGSAMHQMLHFQKKIKIIFLSQMEKFLYKKNSLWRLGQH